MTPLQLNPSGIATLSHVILCLVITGILWRTPRKSDSTRQLIAFFLGCSAVLLLQLCATCVLKDSFLRVLIPMRVWLSLGALVPLLAFAYELHVDTFPREHRVVRLFAVGALAAVVPLGLRFLTRSELSGFATTSPLHIAYTLLCAESLWMLVVLVRKAVRLSGLADDPPSASRPALLLAEPRLRGPLLRRPLQHLARHLAQHLADQLDHLLHPRGKAARDLRAFASAVLVLALIVLSFAARALGLISSERGAILVDLGQLVFLWSFALAYLDCAPEPTTFVIKIVLTALFLLLSSLTAAAWLVLPALAAADAGPTALRLAAVTLGSAVLLLLLLPLFLRRCLTGPLHALLAGVREVNAGRRDVEVPRFYNDEIGFLAVSFNSMVQGLAQADRMKDEFLANTSHELRTPLSGIIGIAESMLDGPASELLPAQRHNLSMIVQSGKRLANLVNDLLDFAKLKSKELKLVVRPLDLHSLTDVVLTLCAPLVGKKELQILNAVPPDVLPVLADEDRVQQILYNLVGNAIKFTERGHVLVSARREDSGPDSRVAVTVADTGCGIPDEQRERIFQAFEQGDSSPVRLHGGTGLGLSIAHKLTALHGGELRLDSRAGEGARFTFTLPISREAAGASHPDQLRIRNAVAGHSPLRMSMVPLPTLPLSLSGPRYRLLVVDDEPVNLMVLTNQLMPLSYTLVKAQSGVEALAAIEQAARDGRDVPFDLILLDIMMPRMSGYEVCRRIRERYPASELPIVMLTARNRDADLVEAFRVGANDYLVKPWSKSELISRIQTHLRLAKINVAYSRFVPRQFLTFLAKDSILDVTLGDGAQQVMTVLFADIRSFTTLSEQMTPRQSFDFINSYLRAVGPTMRDHGGFIDKYIGDAIMALFPRGPEDAVRALCAMRSKVKALNEELQRQGSRPIHIGIGVHTGPLMLGVIGEEQRLEGTVIGDAVNLASRLESLTKQYGVTALVSGSTLSQLSSRDAFAHRYLGKVRVKGKQNSIDVFEVFEGDPEELRARKARTKGQLEEAIRRYHIKDFTSAAELLDGLSQISPDDRVVELYRQRCALHVSGVTLRFDEDEN
jgi:two-component system sensor histidine kinase ChiS